MSATRVQLNARVSQSLRDKVRDDAHRNRVTNDVVVSAIVSDFFKSWTLTERAAFYERFTKKEKGERETLTPPL